MGKSNENCGPDTCIVSLNGGFLKLNQLMRANSYLAALRPFIVGMYRETWLSQL